MKRRGEIIMDKINDHLKNLDSFVGYNKAKEVVKNTYANYSQDVISSEFEGDFYKTIGYDTIFLGKQIELKELDISKLQTSKTVVEQLNLISNSNMTNAEKEYLRTHIIFNSKWHYNDDILHLAIDPINGGNYIKINFSSKLVNNYGLIKDLKEVHDILDKALTELFNQDMNLKSFKVSRLDLSADIETDNNFNNLYSYLDSLKIPRLDHENHGSLNSKSIYYKNGSEQVNIYDKSLELLEKDNIKISKNIIRLERRRFKNVSNTYGVKTFGELIEHQENVKDEFRLWLKEIYEDNKHTFLVKKDINTILKNVGNLSDKEVQEIIFINHILDLGVNKYLKSRPRSTRGNTKKMINKKLKKYNDFFDKQNGLIQDIEKIFL